MGEYGILNKILLHGEQGMGSAPCGVLSQERRGKGLLNLRFKWVVISSLFYVMYAVPKAEYMLRHPESIRMKRNSHLR